jgi:hypothetical protein
MERVTSAVSKAYEMSYVNEMELPERLWNQLTDFRETSYEGFAICNYSSSWDESPSAFADV